MSQFSDYLAVIAIDFGTTYSGFAYAFNHQKFRAGKQGIHMNKEWGHGRGVSTLQTPTCLLLNPNRSFNSFGYTAQAKYIGLDEPLDKGYYFFDRFKMKLHHQETIDERTEITASNGKSLKALDVFAHAIRYLSDEALAVMSLRSGKQFTKGEMLWVLTVPAIWKQVSKQFMREASCKAGIISDDNPDQLIIALEPEAASLECRERNMAGFVNESDGGKCGDVVAKPGSCYMVVDSGGGTVDITAHRINKDGSVDEIYRPTGGAWGGTLVEEEFENLLCQLFGRSFIRNFKINAPADWIDIISDFEMKKRSPDFVTHDEETRIRLPHEFAATGKISSSLWFSEKDAKISRGCLCLSADVMKGLFRKPLTEISKHLSGLLSQPQLKDISSIFLVGGFSENALLQEKIKEKHGSQFRILTPTDASLAVVKGAVMFGLKPDSIKSRISPYTYGTRLANKFEPGKHDAKYKFNHKGVDRIGVFRKLITIDEEVKIGEVRTFTSNPIDDDQTACDFLFFTTTLKNVEYVDEPHVKEVGRVTLPIPDTTKGTDRQLKLTVEFGRTEIKATTFDEESKNERTISIGFLKKDSY